MKKRLIKRMRRIYKANYKKAEKAAYNLLIRANVRQLPVKVMELAKLFPNLRIKTYSWFAKNHNLSIEEVCEYTGSTLGCCWYYKSLGKYLILYNDQEQNIGRKRWTIAHELGHFILKHNEITKKASLSRGDFTDDEYKILESEANCFARSLLAPPHVITHINGLDIRCLTELCEVSFEAAEYIMIFLENGFEMGKTYSKQHEIYRLFSEFIFKTNNRYQCANCNNKFHVFSPSFCFVCGSKNIFRLFPFERIDSEMYYTGYQLDNNSRALRCPVCDNESILGDYCHICGTYLINKCTLHWCNELLPGNARFCYKCGSPSTYYEHGLLKKWNYNPILEIQEADITF